MWAIVTETKRDLSFSHVKGFKIAGVGEVAK